MRKILLYCVYMVLMVPGLGFAQPTLDDLFKAVRIGDVAEVQVLLSRGMDVNSTDPAGNSILMEAAREGKPEVVTLLIARKVRVNAQNAVGDTAIMIAALTGRFEIVQQLRKARRAHRPARVDSAALRRVWRPRSYLRVLDCARCRRQCRLGERHDAPDDGRPRRSRGRRKGPTERPCGSEHEDRDRSNGAAVGSRWG